MFEYQLYIVGRVNNANSLKGSLGIQIAVLNALAPPRGRIIARIAPSAMICVFVSSSVLFYIQAYMTAATLPSRLRKSYLLRCIPIFILIQLLSSSTMQTAGIVYVSLFIINYLNVDFVIAACWYNHANVSFRTSHS